ncbi:hypothetical protein C8J57DRAFT_1368436, partial [Mycena rebaudengoi]
WVVVGCCAFKFFLSSSMTAPPSKMNPLLFEALAAWSLISVASAIGLQPLSIFIKVCNIIVDFLIDIFLFCMAMLSQAFFAALAATALSAIFFTLTAFSSLFCADNALVQVPKHHFTYATRFFNVTAVLFGPSRPWSSVTLEERWRRHAYNILHVTTFAGIPPVLVFLAVTVPILLALSLVRHRRSTVGLCEAEIEKRCAAEEVLRRFQVICDARAKPVVDIAAAILCPLCSKTFTQPYTVAPCGHTFDLECLQDAFLNAPPTPLDTRLQLRKVRTRQKLCPHPGCGVEVLVPPAPAWTVRSVASTVAPVGKELPPVQEMEEDEPWVGIFDSYVIPRLGVLKAGGNRVPGIPV